MIVAQDTTEVDLTRPARVVGGPLSDDRRCGFFAHVSLAITTAGVPLGVLASPMWARGPRGPPRPTSRTRMQNARTVYQVVAWRVLLLTMLGRPTPDVSCEAVLAESEWKAVCAVVARQAAPEEPPTLGTMVRLIAMRGGHLGRASDPPPGPKAMWVGLQQARTLARGWETFGPGAKTYA